LETTLALEVNATKIYLCASDSSNNDEIKNLFKAFAKNELEHVSLLTKALGASKPATDLDKTLCTNNDIENLAKTAALEETAMKLYGKFLSEATEKRVQEIFTALIDVESDHLKLANKKLGQR
jgi:rubrerythrin